MISKADKTITCLLSDVLEKQCNDPHRLNYLTCHFTDEKNCSCNRLDMINVTSHSVYDLGLRHKVKCSNIVASDSNVISWSNTIRYLGVNIVAGHKFTCSLDNCKRSFYRTFNAIFGKVGRIASEDVIIELLKAKCLPAL